MVTLSSCIIWQIINFIIPPNEYDCVYAWTTLGNITTDRLTEDADFGKKKIIFSDEAHFDFGGYVSKQSCCIWGTENPHEYVEKPTHPKRVTVWSGFWSRGIIGPFFFENEQGVTVTVSDGRYRALLKKLTRQYLVSTERFYVPHSRSYTRRFAPYFWKSHYQPRSWCHLGTSELRFDTVGLLFVEFRQK